MISDTLIIAAVIFISIYLFATIFYLIFRQYMRVREKERAVEYARLDDFRAHLERQLMELNLKFASSEGRFRELNHLVIAGQNEKRGELAINTKVPPSNFLRSHGINSADLKIRNNLLFVLTPFHDDLQDEFYVVTQVGQQLGFNVARGDEKVSKGDIFPQLLQMIVEAKVIVANISGRNPNVFYELGIAHALDKQVILLAESNSDVPFDIRSKRIVFYQSHDELRERLTLMVARTISAEHV
ncbi:MAG: hypothetical protein ACT4NL_15010 [Pseudomarimonas sp.]